jgi:hypothetical protein
VYEGPNAYAVPGPPKKADIFTFTRSMKILFVNQVVCYII